MSDDQRCVAAGGAIAGWFARGHRDLPWRRTRDPYAVWVSEIMLQQTRVDTVAPRFVRWMARFPTVSALAEAPLDDVLAEWAGLGYYARARNLHSAAREVATRYGGRVPDSEAAISELPGIGRYTAGAILSIAYDRAVPLLDGNVERVLARLFRVGGDPKGKEAKARLWGLAERIVSLATNAPSPELHSYGGGSFSPSQVNQGLMEWGAVVCTPRRPACLACPAEKLCEARRAGAQEDYPGKSRAQKVTAMEQVSVALFRGGKVLLARRPAEGLWGGLYELPSDEIVVGETVIGAAQRVTRERAGLSIDAGQFTALPAPANRFEHVLSHRRITFNGLFAEAPAGAVKRSFYDAHQWVTLRAAASLGVSRATTMLLEATAARLPSNKR